MRLRRTAVRRRRVAIRRRMPRKFRRTGLRRHKSIGTQITIQYCTYLNLSSAKSSLPAYMTANYHMQNIMQNLISSAPNFTNLIQAYEYVALKRARVTYFNTGIHNLGNVTNNTNYPPVHAAIYYDSYSNPVGLGSNPALVLSKMPGAQSVVGRGTIGKTIYGYAVCKKLNMPYWYPTATASGSYYIPPVGVIPIVTIGANTIDGVLTPGHRFAVWSVFGPWCPSRT